MKFNGIGLIVPIRKRANNKRCSRSRICMSLRDLASEVGETNLHMPTGQDNVGVVRVCVKCT